MPTSSPPPPPLLLPAGRAKIETTESNPPYKIPWYHATDVALWAWLDFCNLPQHQMIFNDTILQHLTATHKKEKGLTHHYTLKSVWRRLSSMSHRSSRGDIRRSVSECISELSPELQKDIQDAVAQYTQEHSETKYKHEPNPASSYSILDSPAPSTNTHNKKNVWNHDIQVAMAAWLDFCNMNSQQVSFDGTISQHLIATYKEATGEIYNYTVRAAKQKLYMITDRSKASEFREKGSECIADLSPEHRKEIKDALTRYTEEHWETRYQHGLPHPRKQADLDQDPSSISVDSYSNQRPKVTADTMSPPVKHFREKPARRITLMSQVATSPDDKWQAALTRKNLEIETMRSKWYQEVDDLRDMLSQSKRSELALRAENQHLVIARQQREAAGKDPLEQELFQLTGTIWSLNKRVYEMQKLASFANPREETSKVLEPAVVDEAMDNIASELEMLMYGHTPNTRLLTPTAAGNFDLVDLLGSIFEGSAGEPQDHMARLHDMIEKYRHGSVVRILTVAALRKWVFATAFPDFSPRDVPLLKAYRKIIITHDGWSRLHNLELATYNALIEEKGFQEIVIPRKAEELATRLSQALGPLFTNNTQHPESWGDNLDVSEERHARFMEVFENALRLKASIVAVDQSFEFVLYEPGTTTNHTASQDQAHWKLASMHIYRSEASSPRDALEDAIVKSKNMVNKNEEQRTHSSLHTKILFVPKQVSGDIASREITSRYRSVSVESSSGDEEDRDSDGAYRGHGSRKPGLDTRKGLTYNCDVCGRSFVSERNLIRHKEREACAKCSECAMYFPTDAELRTHRNSEHRHSESPIKVDRAPKPDRAPRSERKDRYASHVTKDSSDIFKKVGKNFACAHCSKQAYHKSHLIDHVRSEHPGVYTESELEYVPDRRSLKKRKRKDSSENEDDEDDEDDEGEEDESGDSEVRQLKDGGKRRRLELKHLTRQQSEPEPDESKRDDDADKMVDIQVKLDVDRDLDREVPATQHSSSNSLLSLEEFHKPQKEQEQAPPLETRTLSATWSSSSKRSRLSCENCTKIKAKCDGQAPCSRCVSDEIHESCKYVKRGRGRPRLDGSPSITRMNDESDDGEYMC
ncbi:hypothetical protein LZ554_000296 [Drepanopeziza brunnea f. sp. 'monogermtubi']|nr:hypothetical protein LZ554_000296 [Drepanopeziza brunnea f. sp. 'monogermtubi']